MLTAHDWVAYAVIAVAGLAAVWGGVTYLRRAEAGATLGHVLALVQTVCVAQVALGLLLIGATAGEPRTTSTTSTARSRCSCPGALVLRAD